MSTILLLNHTFTIFVAGFDEYHVGNCCSILRIYHSKRVIIVIIRQKAKRSYQKDMASFQQARDSNLQALAALEDGEGTAGGFSGGTKNFEVMLLSFFVF